MNRERVVLCEEKREPTCWEEGVMPKKKNRGGGGGAVEGGGGDARADGTTTAAAEIISVGSTIKASSSGFRYSTF